MTTPDPCPSGTTPSRVAARASETTPAERLAWLESSLTSPLAARALEIDRRRRQADAHAWTERKSGPQPDPVRGPR